MNEEEVSKAMGEGRGKVIVTFQVLRELLCLPDDAIIYGIEMTSDDLSRDQFKVFVKHDSLPGWHEGQAVQTVGVNILITTAVVKREFLGWL